MKKLLAGLFIFGFLFIGIQKVHASVFDDIILNIKNNIFSIKTTVISTKVNSGIASLIVESPTATFIGPSSAILGANVTSFGNPGIISVRGICYGASLNNPSFQNNAICVNAVGTTTGLYKITITGLSPNTSYNFAGFAKNGVDIAYSKQGTFITENNPVKKNINSSVCEESAIYFDEYKKGSVLNNQSKLRSTDYCEVNTIQSTSVIKYACVNNTVRIRVLPCPYGCTMGACIKNPYLSIISPNGGESIEIKTPLTIKWNYRSKGGDTTNVSLASGINYDLYLVQYTVPVCFEYNKLTGIDHCDFIPSETAIVKNVQMGNTFDWIVGKVSDPKNTLSYYDQKISSYLSIGKYKIKICVANSSICDISDDFFTIKDIKKEKQILPVEPITILNPNGGEIFIQGITQMIKWKDRTVDQTINKNTNMYDISLVNTESVADNRYNYNYTSSEYSIAKQITNTDSFSWTYGKVSDPITKSVFSVPDGTYKIKVCISDSKNCDTSDNLFGLIASSMNCPAISQPSPVCDIGISLQAVKDINGCIVKFRCDTGGSGYRR